MLDIKSSIVFMLLVLLYFINTGKLLVSYSKLDILRSTLLSICER